LDFNGLLNSINERKEDKHAFWSLIMILEAIVDITKKVPGLVN